jgi:hypothetical protein
LSPLSRLIGATLLAALSPAAALAAGEPEPPAAGEAFGGAKAPYARVVLFYGAQVGEVLRSKGVVKFKQVDTGTYCIKTEMNIRKAIPTVSIEWVQSNSPGGAGILAHWVGDVSFSCANAKRWIEVRTYAFSGVQTADLSDDVAFLLTVR